MIGQYDHKKVKKLKDFREPMISARMASKENSSIINVRQNMSPSLSFKKMSTRREQNSVFTSPSKMFVIDTLPIENIDLSSQKKKLFLKNKLINDQTKQERAPVQRKHSSSSYKTDGSNKKNLYSQFSQLAQLNNKQKKISTVSTLCFKNIDKNSLQPFIPQKSKFQKLKSPPKQKIQQPNLKQKKNQKIQQSFVMKLRKHTSNTIVQMHNNRKLSLSPLMKIHSKPNEQQQKSEHQFPYRFSESPLFSRKVSNQSIEQQVRISMTMSKQQQLDMSPFI